MRIAVTGATGLVGHQVAGSALAAGHEVVALVRSPSAHRNLARSLSRGLPTGAEQALTIRTAQLTDAAQLTRGLAGCEALVHCAAVYAYGAARAAEVARVNIDGTRAVIRAAAAAGLAKVVVTSSSVACGSSVAPYPRTEADHPAQEPAPDYYASKLAQEEVSLETAAAHGIHLVLGLPTVVLGGPYGRLGPSNAIVLRYLLDPTRSTFPGGCNVVDARDVGAGLLTLLERGTDGCRYLLGGQDLTWRELHTLVADLAGLPGPFAEVPQAGAWLASAAAEGWARLTSSTPLSTREEAGTVGRYYWYSCARAAELGYTARPARAAVAASLAWLAIGPDLPRWVKEGLRLSEEVRAARPLSARPLTESPLRRPRPPRPRPPRRPR